MPYGEVKRAVLERINRLVGRTNNHRAYNEEAGGSRQDDDAKNKAYTTGDLDRLVSSIDSFTNQHQAQYQENRTNDEKSYKTVQRTFWTTVVGVVFAVAAALGAVGSAYFAGIQIGDAERQDIRQNRAYMYIESIGFKLDSFPVPATGTTLTAAFQFKNGGNTPAYNIVAITRGKFLEFPLREPIESYNKGMGVPSFTNTIFAYKGQGANEAAKSVFTLSPSEASTFFTTTIERYYIWGEVTWDDVFYINHWLHFCFYVGGPTDFPIAQAVPNSLTACDRYNDSDRNDHK